MISVVMSVYNHEKYVSEAIDSILNQSFKDFEFIIINDGSTDKSLEMIKSFKDKRIILIDRENKGLVSSLNEGLDIAKYDLIARMDSDDIAHPERFKEQLLVMKNEKIVCCGSNLEIFDENQSALIRKLEKDSEIKAGMLIKNQINHPSVMMRKTDLRYDKNFYKIEDYNYFTELEKYGEFYNIQKPLLKYRIVKNSEGRTMDTSRITKSYIESVKNIILKQHKMIGLESSETERDIHFLMMNKERMTKYEIPLNVIENYFSKLERYNIYDKKVLFKILSDTWKFNFIIHKDIKSLNSKYMIKGLF